MAEILLITLAAVVVNNYVLARILGLCPFIGLSTKLSDAVGMGVAVTFVMGMSAAATWPIQKYILDNDKLQIGFMQTVVFILVIASLVQLVDLFLLKFIPNLHRAFGIYLPLITTNCCILGVTILNISEKYGFVASVFNAIGGGIGFLLALALMAGIRERVAVSNVPKSLQGAPIAFILTGLMALAFLGFSGMM